MQYLERTYRRHILKNNLQSYQVTVRETDLFISSDIELKQAALQSVHRHRAHLEAYIAGHPEFLGALSPLKNDDLAPDIVRDMLNAARVAGVSGIHARHRVWPVVPVQLDDPSRGALCDQGSFVVPGRVERRR